MKKKEKKSSSFRDSLLMERWLALREDQNLLLGIIGGTIVAILSAILWALVAVFSGCQIFVMAALMGFFVGSAIKISGMAVDFVYRILGSIISVLGCVLGNLLATISLISFNQNEGFITVLAWINMETIMEIVPYIFSSADWLFYLVAAICGYYFSVNNYFKGYNYFNKKGVKEVIRH